MGTEKKSFSKYLDDDTSISTPFTTDNSIDKSKTSAFLNDDIENDKLGFSTSTPASFSYETARKYIPGELDPTQDLRNKIAENQASLDQFANGVIKGTGLAATTFLTTFTSLPYGIVSAISEGKASITSRFFLAVFSVL